MNVPQAAPPRFKLVLFVAGPGQPATDAIANINRICDEYLGGCDFQIVDILDDPTAANVHRIIAIPTLIKEEPGPTMRLIGDLSNTAKVLSGLGVAAT